MVIVSEYSSHVWRDEVALFPLFLVMVWDGISYAKLCWETQRDDQSKKRLSPNPGKHFLMSPFFLHKITMIKIRTKNKFC